MIRGAQQAAEYGSAATPLQYIPVDSDGRERWPDSYPTIEISDPSGTQLVAPATVKASLDMAAAGCVNLDTVFQMTSEGDWGNDWTIQTASAAGAAVTVNRTTKTILIEFISTTTTVADVEALVGALTKDKNVIEVGTAGTGANILTDVAGADVLAATNLAGGTGAAMVPDIAVTEGYLDYDTQTAEYEIGEKATGGTSTATGIIRGQVQLGASGVLHLGKVDGPANIKFQDNETVTDSGTGSAKANGCLYSAVHTYMVDASATGTWEIAQDYHAEIVYAVDGFTYKYDLYFDVAYAPMCRPFVTSADVEISHPTWSKFLPKDWQDWTTAVRGGHSDLVRRIHKYGEQAADFVKRESEFWDIEMAFIERWIAIHCGFDSDDRKYWEDNAESVWTHRGRVTVQKDDDAEIEEERQNLPRSGTVR